MAEPSWDAFPVASQQPAQPFSGYIPAAPKQPAPLEISREKRSERDSDLNNENTDFDNAGTLRDDFERLPSVTAYRTSVPMYATALKTQPIPEGDLTLIKAYAKLTDPTTGVLNGEGQAVAESSPYFERTVQNLQNQLDASGLLSSRAREGLRQELRSLMRNRNRAYIADRVTYKKRASARGFDPEEIVGPHAGIPFQGEESDYIGRPVPQLDYNGNPVSGQTDPQQSPLLGGGGDGSEGLAVDISYTPGGVADWYDTLTDEQKNAYREGSLQPPQAVTDAENRAKSELEKQRDTPIGSVDAVIRGAADVATFGFADELAAVGDTVFKGGTYQQNLDQERAIDKADEAVNPYLRLGGQAALALGLPSGIGAATARGGMRAGALRAGAEGAGYGAGYGFGSGENMQDRGVNALLGGTTGGALGYGAGRLIPPAIDVVSNARNSLMPARSARPANIMAAANRQGVEMLPADVGGASLKTMTSAAGQAPFSAGSVRSVAQRSADQMGDAANRAAKGAGQILPEDQAGQIARKGGNDYIEQTRARASKLYDKAETASQGVRVEPKTAIAYIDQEIALKQQAGEISDGIVEELQKLKRSLSQKGGMTIKGIREARTILGGMARTDKLRGTDAKRIFNNVLDAAAQDIDASLVASGNSAAASMFKKADMLWRERIEEIDDVLEPVIGKAKSGEDIVKAVEAMARGNRGGVKRLGGLLRALPEKERGDLTATIIERMGKAKASAQDEAGSVFSSETFLTNWNQMSPAGKSALFADKGLRQNLDDIALIAAGKRETNKLASKSNTPAGIMSNLAFNGTLGFGTMGVPGIALLTIGQYGMGKLLASKALTNWIARAPRNATPAAQKAYVQGLQKVAAREPAMTAEIIQFKDYLAKSLSESPGRAAASEQEGDGRGKPPQ